MTTNERTLDFHIGKLLDLADIPYTPNGSDIKEIEEALKTASKKVQVGLVFQNLLQSQVNLY